METLWFCLVAFMLAAYVILDGFDLGVGIVHLLVGRNAEERKQVLAAIAPYWDGNEVWLLAAGGTLYFAFPLLYASSFSGFYLPLMIVLWLLMLRGGGIEFRHQIHHPLWISFWDTLFSVSSILLAIFFGAALGNVVRGVPLNEEGYFFEPLWTTFTVVPDAGILDWFTILMGVIAGCTLTSHGALYLAMKTTGTIQERSRSIASAAWWSVAGTSALGLIATSAIRPQIWGNFSTYGWGYIFPALALCGLCGIWVFGRKRRDAAAFISSSVFIGAMLSTTAFGLYPNLLPSSIDSSPAITVSRAAAGTYGLNIGLVWWIIGIVLALGYFSFVYRTFRGKSTPETPVSEGY
ncbi:MAG TPA: cytochrome d ubiquinol oxidase subunit II [Bacteroidota bacterium]|nr:cytochrome d ubiquinol oxidase subunit II [Bacteroidota bacterium]